MGKKKSVCFEYRCHEPPHIGGRCSKHHEEQKRKQRDREDALEALNNVKVDGSSPSNSSLQEQLFDIRKWWFRACDALAYRRTDSILRDEAEYAQEWCIALAKEIVTAERAVRSGKGPDFMLEHTSKMVYERFSNMEKGLMSNGVPRPERR